MTKVSTKAALAFDKASPTLLKQVEGVIAESKKHTFSVSRVYAAYNAVFNLNEQPQSCASCLRTRAEKLAKWFYAGDKAKQDGSEAAHTAEDTTDGPTPEAPEAPEAPEGGAVLTVDADGNVTGDGEYPVTYIIIDNEEFHAVEEDGVTLANIAFNAAEEGAQFGNAIDSHGVPVPAGVYSQDGKAYSVSGEEGNYTEVTGEPVAEAKTKEEAPAQPVEGTTVLTLKEEGAQPVHFLTEDLSVAVLGSKGTVKNADGSNVKTGTHELADGNKLAVAVGGRATIK